MTIQTINATNSLRYNISKTLEDKTIYVKIRLDDECKNGHQDFSITGDLYQANKPKIDKYNISGGCIHDEILKFFPEFKIFVDLHLCDYTGTPMYAVENGFYHLREGFNNTKIDDAKFKNEYCDYYRITSEQFDILNKCVNQIQFALKIKELGILNQWKAQADKAIKILEGLTESKFIIDSVKTQFHEPTDEQIAEEQEKQANGYYTPEAMQQRENERLQGKRNELIANYQEDIDKANFEREIMLRVFDIGGELAYENCIYYNHVKELAFNWNNASYRKAVSAEVVSKIAHELNIPGVTVINKAK